MAATLLLLALPPFVWGGAGLATDQHGCRRLCETVVGLNDTEPLEKVSACEEGCITVSHCLHHHHFLEEKSRSMASDMSRSCLAMCENSCTTLHSEKLHLGPACVHGCVAQHRQIDGLEAVADAQYLSQRVEVLEDAVPGVGIKEDKSHNVSLNLGGNIQTNITSNAFVGPKIEKGGITTRGGKKIEDRTIKFDIQGGIDNDTIAEKTLSRHGKKGVVSSGKRGKEYSENASINIQGVVSQNGSYVDVSSHYKPRMKRTYTSSSKRKGGKQRKKSKRRPQNKSKRRKAQSRKRKLKKPKAKKLNQKVIPKKVAKVAPKDIEEVVQKKQKEGIPKKVDKVAPTDIEEVVQKKIEKIGKTPVTKE